MIKNIKQPDFGFAERFLVALERAEGVPERSHGRLTWLVRKIEERFGASLTVETVRKWSIGETKPREKNMRILADIFKVDVEWLQFGRGEINTQKEQLLSTRKLNGTVHSVLGFFLSSGENATVSEDHGIDVVVIRSGSLVTIAAAEVISLSQGRFKIKFSPTAAKKVAFVANISDCTMLFIVDLAEIIKKCTRTVATIEAECFCEDDELFVNDEIVKPDIFVKMTSVI